MRMGGVEDTSWNGSGCWSVVKISLYVKSGRWKSGERYCAPVNGVIKAEQDTEAGPRENSVRMDKGDMIEREIPLCGGRKKTIGRQELPD